MKHIVVGIAGAAISQDPDAELVTYALGSCIALMLYDAEAGVAGLVHYMLPDSAQSGEASVGRPWMFADTGIPLLLHAASERGADRRRMILSAAGGAQVMDERGIFDIGKRNCLALRKILWKFGLVVHAADTGGSEARTVHMEVGSGRIWLQSPGQEPREMSSPSHAARQMTAKGG